MGDSQLTCAGLLALVLALGLTGCAASVNPAASSRAPSQAPASDRSEPATDEAAASPTEDSAAAPLAIVDISSAAGDASSPGLSEDVEAALVAPALLGELKIQYPERVSAIDRRPPSSIRTSSVRVVLQVLVNTEGRPQHISIRSSDRPGSPFEDSAVESVRKARFMPGTRDGEPTAAWALVQIAFPTP